VDGFYTTDAVASIGSLGAIILLAPWGKRGQGYKGSRAPCLSMVPMQSLVDHTSTRIIQMQSSFIIERARLSGRKETLATLICFYGFDGSTGQSNYKQLFKRNSD